MCVLGVLIHPMMWYWHRIQRCVSTDHWSTATGLRSSSVLTPDHDKQIYLVTLTGSDTHNSWAEHPVSTLISCWWCVDIPQIDDLTLRALNLGNIDWNIKTSVRSLHSSIVISLCCSLDLKYCHNPSPSPKSKVQSLKLNWLGVTLFCWESQTLDSN